MPSLQEASLGRGRDRMGPGIRFIFAIAGNGLHGLRFDAPGQAERPPQAAALVAAFWWMSRATTSPQYRMMETEISSQRASTMMPSRVP